MNVMTIYLAPTSGSLPAWTLTYGYYPDGSRKTMTLASGSSSYPSTYTYDAAGRMTGLVNPFSEKTAWSYQANDWLANQVANATATTPLETSYTYDPRGWMKELKTTQGLQGNGLTPAVAADFSGSGTTPQMSYDALGNRTGFTASGFPTGTNTLNGIASFVYDARDELTSQSSARNGGYTWPMVYDSTTMNTTTGPGNETTARNITLAYDAKGDNQIASDSGNHAWAYDGDGNPTTYLSSAETYDPENRMTNAAVPAGGGHARLKMGYDDDGMRAWKETATPARTYFLYDGSTLVAELSSAGLLANFRTVGPDGLVSRRSGSTSTFYAFDPSGNPSVVFNASGMVLGNELFEANGRRDGTYTAQPVDFGGQWGYYADSEVSLVLLGHRYYDAIAGRFLTRDPIGYDGGVNLYSYTANNYVNEIDPSGHSAALALALNQGVQVGLKAAAAEEAAGGGPENPLADYAAALTLATVLAYQTSNALADVYIRPQDGLAAPHVFPQTKTRQTFVCATKREERKDEDEQIRDLLVRRGKSGDPGPARRRLHDKIRKTKDKMRVRGRTNPDLSQEVLEQIADQLFGPPEELVDEDDGDEESEIVEDIISE